MKKQVYCYYLHVNGIFGRNRKPKTDIVYLSRHNETRLDHDKIDPVPKLKEIKLRGKWALVERVGTVEEGIYSTDLFGGMKELKRGEISL
jgi:hypothetical protein